MNIKGALIISSLLIYGNVNAEVLDKFGGCKWPISLSVLGGFAILILLSSWLKRKKITTLLVALSAGHILVGIVWPFFAAKKWIPSWYDQANFDFFSEIDQCPQFEYIGYWGTIWLAVVCYIIFTAITWLLIRKVQ